MIIFYLLCAVGAVGGFAEIKYRLFSRLHYPKLMILASPAIVFMFSCGLGYALFSLASRW